MVKKDTNIEDLRYKTAEEELNIMFKREELLTKELLIIQKELIDIMHNIDDKPMKMSAVIGGRINIIANFIKEQSKDNLFELKLNKYIDDLNTEIKDAKDKEAAKLLKKDTYFG